MTMPVDVSMQDINHQIRQLSTNARLAAFIAPFAAASSDSLTAVYTRTFERAAFGFAKVHECAWLHAPGACRIAGCMPLIIACVHGMHCAQLHLSHHSCDC